MKQLLTTKHFWQDSLTFPSILFTIATGLLSFFDWDFRHKIFYALLIASFIIIIFYLLRYSNKQSIELSLNGSKVEVGVGDIFNQESDDIKVIAFNEYFDTKVDEQIITSNSLNGTYLEKFYPDKSDRKRLDHEILQNPKMQSKIIKNNVNRSGNGKSTKYKLGSVYKDNNFFLVAFSRFNEENKATLRLSEYANCLLQFWDEVNNLYNKKTVVLPLLGAGITEHENFLAEDQQLLEVLIWTFKISKVKLKKPARVKIIIHESQQDDINFYKLKEVKKIGI